jgi:hypothetical protein
MFSKIMKISCFCLFFLFYQNILAQSNTIVPESNLEIFKKIYYDISGEIIKQIPDSIKQYNLIISGKQNNWVVENLIREYMPKNNHDNKINNLVNYNIEIDHDSKVIYKKTSNNDNIVNRYFTCQVLTRMRFNDITTIKNFNKSYSDSIQTSYIPLVEHDKITVFQDYEEDKNIFDILFEPLIILSSVGILVYLFFSVRSN